MKIGKVINKQYADFTKRAKQVENPVFFSSGGAGMDSTFWLKLWSEAKEKGIGIPVKLNIPSFDLATNKVEKEGSRIDGKTIVQISGTCKVKNEEKTIILFFDDYMCFLKACKDKNSNVKHNNTLYVFLRDSEEWANVAKLCYDEEGKEIVRTEKAADLLAA